MDHLHDFLDHPTRFTRRRHLRHGGVHPPATGRSHDFVLPRMPDQQARRRRRLLGLNLGETDAGVFEIRSETSGNHFGDAQLSGRFSTDWSGYGARASACCFPPAALAATPMARSFLASRTGPGPILRLQDCRERPPPPMLVWPPWMMVVYAAVFLLLLQLTCATLIERKARRVQEADAAVAAQAAYRRQLRSTLETRIEARVEDVLRRSDAKGQVLLYDTLRAYLMQGQRAHVDAGAAPLDAALVARARQALAGMPLSARAYSLAKHMVAQDSAGISAEPPAHGVDGLYSVAGYRRLAQLSWRATADLARDDRVLARREAASGPGTVVPARMAVMQLYFADYIRAWDAFLGDLHRAPPAHVRVLLTRAARETRLAAARVDALAPGMGRLLQDQPGLVRRQPQLAAAHPVDQHFAVLHRFVANPACRPSEWRGLSQEAQQRARPGCDQR